MSEPDKKLTVPVVTPLGKAPGSVHGSTPPPAPELRVALAGFMTEEERAAIRDAYYNGARGDPKSYPVQIALVQRALFMALDAAPEQIGQRLDATLQTLNVLLSHYHAGVKANTEAVNHHAKLATEQIESIRTEVRQELHQHRTATARQMAELRQELRQEVARLSDEANRFQQRADALKAYQEHVYWIAGFAIFLFGFVVFPIVGAAVEAIRNFLHL